MRNIKIFFIVIAITLITGCSYFNNEKVSTQAEYRVEKTGLKYHNAAVDSGIIVKWAGSEHVAYLDTSKGKESLYIYDAEQNLVETVGPFDHFIVIEPTQSGGFYFTSHFTDNLGNERYNLTIFDEDVKRIYEYQSRARIFVYSQKGPNLRYRYGLQGREACIDQDGNVLWDLGPYDNLNVVLNDDTDLLYSYRELDTDEFYLERINQNKTKWKKGPYKSISYLNSNDDLYSYKYKNDEGEEYLIRINDEGQELNRIGPYKTIYPKYLEAHQRSILYSYYDEEGKGYIVKVDEYGNQLFELGPYKYISNFKQVNDIDYLFSASPYNQSETNPIYLYKTNSTGKELWRSGPYKTMRDVMESDDGFTFVNYEVKYEHISYDLLREYYSSHSIVHIDHDGKVIFKDKPYDKILSDYEGNTIKKLNDGSFVYRYKDEDQYYIKRIDQTGKELWEYSNDGRSINEYFVTSNDEIILIETGTNDGGVNEKFILRLDKDGKELWRLGPNVIHINYFPLKDEFMYIDWEDDHGYLIIVNSAGKTIYKENYIGSSYNSDIYYVEVNGMIEKVLYEEN